MGYKKENLQKKVKEKFDQKIKIFKVEQLFKIF